MFIWIPGKKKTFRETLKDDIAARGRAWAAGLSHHMCTRCGQGFDAAAARDRVCPGCRKARR